MFKFSALKQNDLFKFEVEYSFDTTETIHSLSIEKTNPKEAHLELCNNLVSLLHVRLDELYCQLQGIREHYFNNNLTTYVGQPYNHIWTTGYWKFLGLKQNLQTAINVTTYIEQICTHNFEPIIPAFEKLNHEPIKATVYEIKEIAQKINSSIQKMKSYEN